ncbi:MAG TPA: hypothetical protein VJV03_01035 [Pyrinomonadaceae bacterium]|nr:hypothetical protein [Pyrinomonadaceae bacterium]
MNPTIDEPNNLDEPHFDEEATILSARPVVPLDEVPETRSSKRPVTRVALSLAIIGGLLIGLLAATLIFRYWSVGERATTTAAEQPAQPAEQPPVQPSSPAGGAVATVDEAANESMPEEKPAVTEEKLEPEPEESRRVETPDRPSPVEPRRPVIVRDTPRTDGEDEEEDRATRRSQRQEERREQRRAAREARRQEREQRSTNDDLTRIREIFEGTPRP